MVAHGPRAGAWPGSCRGVVVCCLGDCRRRARARRGEPLGTRTWKTLAIFCAALSCAAIGLAGDSPRSQGPRLTSADLFQVLKARDAQLDNAAVELVVEGVERAKEMVDWRRSLRSPPTAKQAGPEVKVDRPDSQAKGEVIITYRIDEVLVVRGEEVTFEKVLDVAATRSSNPAFSITPFQKWSSAHGQVRDFTKSGGESDESDQVMRLAPQFLGREVGVAHRRNIELALGVGVGRWLRSVESVSYEGEAISVEGVVGLVEGETGRGSMKLASDFVMRRGHFSVSRGGSTYLYDIETDGTYEAEGWRCTKNGRFKLVRTEPRPAAEPTAEGRQVVEEFQVECKEVRFGLDDDEYERLTRMPVEHPMQVMDPNGLLTPEEKRRLSAGPSVGVSWLTYLFGAGGFVLLIGWILTDWLIVRRRARKRLGVARNLGGEVVSPQVLTREGDGT